MKLLKFFPFVMITTLIQSCQSNTPIEEPLRINQIQVIGSHNSYKQAMDAPIMAQLLAIDSNGALALDYQHRRLAQQLDLGMRKLEIDIVHDPEGGRYSNPVSLQELEAAGVEVESLDTAVMNQPGFKVLHIQDIDFRSNCLTLTDCLAEVLEWSNANANHMPIAISFNAKSGVIESRPDFTIPLPFTPAAFDSLDAEILSVIPRERIITPDDVRGDFETLEAAVRAKNWPTLEAARGKFIFVLDEGGEKRENYITGHPSLKDRIMFVSMHPGRPEAGFIIFNDPVNHQDSIRRLVEMGFLVRTRADAGTKEARSGDYTRYEAALASGAQFISTDYYLPDERFGTDYQVKLPGGVIVRCNPVLKPENCVDTNLE